MPLFQSIDQINAYYSPKFESAKSKQEIMVIGNTWLIDAVNYAEKLGWPEHHIQILKDEMKSKIQRAYDRLEPKKEDVLDTIELDQEYKPPQVKTTGKVLLIGLIIGGGYAMYSYLK